MKKLLLSVVALSALCAASLPAQTLVIKETGRGTIFGTRTDQALSFWGIDPPIAQPASTNSVRQVLEKLGLVAAGGSDTANTDALSKVANDTITDGVNYAVGTSTGTKIGTATTQKIGFYNSTPVVQPAQTLTDRAALQLLGFIAADSSNTASATSAAATLSKTRGTITSEALTTAGLADYTLTLTNTLVTTSSIITASADNGTNSHGTIALGAITPGTGSATFVVHNLHATEALNGTIKLRFVIN